MNKLIIKYFYSVLCTVCLFISSCESNNKTHDENNSQDSTQMLTNNTETNRKAGKRFSDNLVNYKPHLYLDPDDSNGDKDYIHLLVKLENNWVLNPDSIEYGEIMDVPDCSGSKYRTINLDIKYQGGASGNEPVYQLVEIQKSELTGVSLINFGVGELNDNSGNRIKGRGVIHRAQAPNKRFKNDK